MSAGLGWGGIARLGAVQASIGAIVMLATSLLNRVMVVEMAVAAAVPAGLVAWHYAVQLTRPMWGHGSDAAARRSPWIIGGMGILAMGALLAVNGTIMMAESRLTGTLLSILAFTMIGAGVGAAGTSLLALLAARVAPERRAAAAAITWIMMVAGIVIAAGVAGSQLEPFSIPRLATVAGGVALVAFIIPLIALSGLENGEALPREDGGERASFPDAIREVRADPEARRFALFVFMSMLAYSMQDLILEPFAGLVFGMTPAQSTALSGAQHGGVLAGMIVAGIGGSAFRGRTPRELARWIIGGCVGSALALVGLAMAEPGWPLQPMVMALGFANGIFAVAAIGAMMGLAGKGTRAREGVRMGVFGAAQAIAFGLGGLAGAIGVDVLRGAIGQDAPAFHLVFAFEAAVFLIAAIVASRATAAEPVPTRFAGAHI